MIVDFPHVEFGFGVEAKSARSRLIQQVHQSKVMEIQSLDQHREMLLKPPTADALLTRAVGIELYLFTADCLPIFLIDSSPQGAVGLIHCGWRGANLNIVERTLERMKTRDLHIILGPAILGCCYEVGKDFMDAFRRSSHYIEPFLDIRNGSRYFHLDKFVIETQLKEVPAHRIHLGTLRCTHCSQPTLPSYRRTGSTDPHIRSWIRKLRAT